MSIRLEAVENQVEVTVEVIHSPAHSRPGGLFYIYFITIKNTGTNTVRLLRRHWDVFDGDGSHQTVDDDGVVGQQPVLKAGEHFTYNSGVPIRQAPGRMGGYYTFTAVDSGHQFRVPIPEFVLYLPEGWSGSSSPSNRVLN
jgi:ApaG protein